MTPRLRILLGLGLAGAALAAGSWWASRVVGLRYGPVRLIVSGDTGGWLVPCGCTSNQSGGLLRRGSYVASVSSNSPVIVADAGGAPGGTSEYDRIKFEAILRGEEAMGLAAHNLGGPEAALGAKVLRELQSHMKSPFVSANLRDDTGKLIAAPVRIVKAGARRFALTGVLSRQFARAGIQIDDPRSAVLDVIAVQAGSYDSLIVLAYLPEEELRALAAALPEADAVIGGPTGQSITPTAIGPTMLAAATNKGKFLVDLTCDAGKWSGVVNELNEAFRDDETQLVHLRMYLSALERWDLPASKTGLAPSAIALPANFRIAGTNACRDCHKDDCTVWESSKHSHAWDSLTARGYHVDPACQTCHTTGYGMPGGFESVGRTPALRSVGCESCHGPSLDHVKHVKVRTSHVARDECARCHDQENSPTFAYDAFWDKIRHGKRPAAGGNR